jgi:hypothetical protein
MQSDFREKPVKNIKEMIEKDFTFYVLHASAEYISNLPEVMKR